jgi:hypothetical protein
MGDYLGNRVLLAIPGPTQAGEVHVREAGSLSPNEGFNSDVKPLSNKISGLILGQPLTIR